MIYTSIHRITENHLVKFIEGNTLIEFKNFKDILGMHEIQYVYADDILKTVWDSGDYEHQLNKIYSNEPLITIGGQDAIEEKNYIDVHLMLKQGYSWKDIFGLHLIVKEVNSNNTLISRICTIDEFQITSNKEIIDGSFWMEEVVLKIPKTSNMISVQITEVKFDDIDTENTLGLIYNYPYELIPIIDEKPIPDYIKTNLSFDENHYLNIIISTNEVKTLEQSILDYFGLEVASIDIRHTITYGNTGLGYKTITISNDDNIYGPINIGLNLLPFIDENNSIVEIFVASKILVDDSKLMTRNAQLNTDLSTLNPFIAALITNPETIYPVEVKKETVISNTVIDTKENTKIIPIYQPIFGEMIKDDLYIENKNVYFPLLTNNSYLEIVKSDKDNSQIIYSKLTSDNKLYFDLSKLQPITVETTYKLVDSVSGMIVGSGKVLIK